MSNNNAMQVSNNKADSTGVVTIHRSVTILRKEGGSAYFKRNAKFIPEGKNKIGSSINSINRLKSSIAEMKAYMPGILGLNDNDPKFGELSNIWFENIGKTVPEDGLTLEVGFVYKSKAMYDTINKSEDEIYTAFNAAKKSTSKDRDLAFKVRDTAIVALERTKYNYGYPINIGDYILWRYCLEYSDVANDIALINKTGGIRFYIYDATQEAYKEKIEFDIRNRATTIYVKLLDSPEKVKQMLWAQQDSNVAVDSMKAIDRAKAIEVLSKVNPSEFIRLYEDKSIGVKADIERMIHYGILRRLDNTNVIVDDNNDLVGNDMNQAIAFFKNEERNKSSIMTLRSKLKSYTNA